MADPMDPLQEFGKLVHSAGFFSRIRIPQRIWVHAEPWRLDDCAAWFPVAGLAIGMVPAGIWLLASTYMPAGVAAGLSLGAGMWLTGCLHEDGLADTADGLGSPRSKEKALEIMRDSRTGVYGAAALILSVLLRWSALLAMAPLAGALALLISHSTGRAAIALALANSSYARTEGAGSLVSQGIPQGRLGRAIGGALLIGGVLGGWAGFLAAVVGLVVAVYVMQRVDKRLGGYTGDTLGAMEQFAEITVMILLATSWWVR
jgi:adenosylcobinamide-GDP ribazoletransferase